MFPNGIQFGGDSLGAHRIAVKNVSSGALTRNGVYSLDLTQSDSDTSGASNKIRASLESIVALAALNITRCMVVVDKAIPAGETGFAYLFGLVKVRANGSATAFPIAPGDRLRAVPGSTDLVNADGGFPYHEGGHSACALALESCTTSQTTIDAIFDGFQVHKDYDPSRPLKLINRTGSALTAGGVYAIDTRQSASESTSPEAGLRHVVAVNSADILNGLLVVALSATPDDAAGNFVGARGTTFVSVTRVNGTTDIAAGDTLTPVAGQAHLVKQAITAGSRQKGVAIALEAFTTDGAGSIKTLFNGSAFPGSANGASS